MVLLHAHLQRETTEKVLSCRDPVGVASFVESASVGTLCARFIDSYGDTVFNREQCGVLRDEWSMMAENAPPELREWMACVAGLIERAATEMHLYVRFQGD